MKHKLYLLAGTLLIAGLFIGCGKASKDSQGTQTTDEPFEIRVHEGNEPQVLDYYASKPSFFTFATPEDIPGDLNWEDGSDQEEFSSPDAQKGGTLRSYFRQFPPTIRFVGPDSNHSFRGAILDENAMGLTMMHPNTRTPIPGIAKRWAVADDRKTVFFELFEDAYYSDGFKITTDDIMFAFYFMQSEFINAPWYNNWYSIEYTNVSRYSERIVSITYSEPKPKPVLISRTSIRPVPRHFYQGLDENYITEYNWKFEPTTGPYELLDRNIRKGTSITLTRVENWWAKDKPFYRNRYNVDRKHYEIVRETTKAFELFALGDFDMFAYPSPEYWYERSQITPFENGYIQRVQFYNEIPRFNEGLWINVAKPLLGDRNIRVGLQHATNWEAVIDDYFRGDRERMRTMNDGYGRFTHPEIEAREFSVAKAEEAFAQAGFTERGRDGIFRNADGERLSFTITVSQGPREKYLPIIKQEAKRAGVEYNIEVLDGTLMFKKVLEKQHEIAVLAWGIGLPYPRFWEGYHSDNANIPQTNNINNFAREDVDNLIEAYDRAQTEDEIERIGHEIQEILHDEAIFIPGPVKPFYRIAHWKWVQFPEFFDVRTSSGPGDYGLYWIDPKVKDSIEDAMRKGESIGTGDAVIYDQWKE